TACAPATAQDKNYRQAALDAATWIRSTALQQNNAVAWPGTPGDAKSVTSLYSGVSGVVLFFLEAHRATKADSYLDDARAGADYLLSALEAEKETGLYVGLAGIGFALEQTYQATREERYRHGVKRSVEMLRERAKKTGAGVEWNDVTDIISGSAGAGRFPLYPARPPKGCARPPP